MKKAFTFALAMAMAVTGFAQVKGLSHKTVSKEAAQVQVYTGLEDINANFPASTRSILVDPEETELAQTYYDWQTNSGQRNHVAIWPDGYAVMCYTMAQSADFSDRGTGLAVYDPAVGEWTYNDERVEDVKTGFGSIARYKENGLVVAAHTASDLRFWINEDFRNGGTTWESVTLTSDAQHEPGWPVVMCSGENLDIVHLLYTNNVAINGISDPILYSRWSNGSFEVEHELLPLLDETHCLDYGSNVTYFLLYNPETPWSTAHGVTARLSFQKTTVQHGARKCSSSILTHSETSRHRCGTHVHHHHSSMLMANSTSFMNGTAAQAQQVTKATTTQLWAQSPTGEKTSH